MKKRTIRTFAATIALSAAALTASTAVDNVLNAVPDDTGWGASDTGAVPYDTGWGAQPSDPGPTQGDTTLD